MLVMLPTRRVRVWQVGADISITRERVRQIEKGALRKLRQPPSASRLSEIFQA